MIGDIVRCGSNHLRRVTFRATLVVIVASSGTSKGCFGSFQPDSRRNGATRWEANIPLKKVEPVLTERWGQNKFVRTRILPTPPRRSTPTCMGRTPRSSRPSPTPAEHPICVGRTVPPELILRHLLEHPHARGEDVYTGAVWNQHNGAPPRAWGGPVQGPRHRLLRRSTPRAWGGLRVVHARAAADRSTPTCVGRTPGGVSPGVGHSEHPHVRGEDQAGGAQRDYQAGAPHVRGEDIRSPSRHSRTGFQEHPHVRGEDWLQPGGLARDDGAPPRAWGGLQQGGPQVRAEGSTPTCVGRTASRRPTSSSTAEHPHVRGEDW